MKSLNSRNKAYESGKLLPTIGSRNGMYGRKQTDKLKNQNSEYMKRAIKEGKYRNKYLFPKGELNPAFNNWSSKLPYDKDFNDEMKLFIKNRDNNQCQICYNKGLAIHHIDYNKLNSNPINLLLLCNSCHSKTNSKREYWKWQLNILQNIRDIK